MQVLSFFIIDKCCFDILYLTERYIQPFLKVNQEFKYLKHHNF